MLVVSRRQNERLVFPNLGISIEILRVAGKTVRVGVEAPSEVRVLRDELLDKQPLASAEQAREAIANLAAKNETARPRDAAGSAPSAERGETSDRHRLRNQLNSANLALHLLRKQLEAGRHADAEETLAQALGAFAELEVVARRQGGDPVQADAWPESPAGAGAGRRALLVEDNAHERELLAAFLRLRGYQVDVVEDGMAALSYLAARERPDLVLLDMQMPRLDGPQTIAAIRGNPDYRDIKLFAVSGMQPDAARSLMGEHGVDRWFSKPLQPAEFACELDAEMSGMAPAA